MIKNSNVTIYHKTLNEVTKLEQWTRYNYIGWVFESKGAGINKGYDNADNVEIRLPYSDNELNIEHFAVGDIIVKGTLDLNIETQQDLSNYEIYNITNIRNNNFGNSPHMHIGGR